MQVQGRRRERPPFSLHSRRQDDSVGFVDSVARHLTIHRQGDRDRTLQVADVHRRLVRQPPMIETAGSVIGPGPDVLVGSDTRQGREHGIASFVDPFEDGGAFRCLRRLARVDRSRRARFDDGGHAGVHASEMHDDVATQPTRTVRDDRVVRGTRQTAKFLGALPKGGEKIRSR